MACVKPVSLVTAVHYILFGLHFEPGVNRPLQCSTHSSLRDQLQVELPA